MTRFKSKLLSLNSSRPKPIKVYSPANCEELRIPFKRDKFAKVVGRLAELPPPGLPSTDEADKDGEEQPNSEEDRIVSGVLVQNGFNLTLMAAEDLKEYAGLTTTSVMFRKRLVCTAGVELVRWGLEGMFGGVKDVSKTRNGVGVNGLKEEGKKEEWDNVTRLQVMDCVTVEIHPNAEMVLEWEGNAMNDTIADSVLSVILQMEVGRAAVKRRFIPFKPLLP